MASERAPVLVVGATGFVGRKLVQELANGGVPVRALVRDPERARRLLPAGVRLVPGELLAPATLRPALAGVPVAYYLAHSMTSVRPGEDFRARDRIAAEHFVTIAGEMGLERIVYVGGLGDDLPGRSAHLASRQEVGRILERGPAQLTQLRAALVVGEGGSSFEMLVQLVERLPLMVCPTWIGTRCQPIDRDDLVRYLVGCLEESATVGRRFDVGGPGVYRYAELMGIVGDRLGARSRLVVAPVLSPHLSAHWVGLITDVPSDLARDLVEGMRVDVVCRDDRIREILPGPLRSFPAALEAALQRRRPRPRRVRQWLTRAFDVLPPESGLWDPFRALRRIGA